MLMRKSGSRSLAVVHGAVIHAQKVSRSLLSPQLAIAKFNFGIEVDGNLIQVMSKVYSTYR